MPSIPPVTEIISPFVTFAVMKMEGKCIQSNSSLRVTAPYLASRVIAVVTCAALAWATVATSPVLFYAAAITTIYATIDFGYMAQVSSNCCRVGCSDEFTRYMNNSTPENLLLQIISSVCHPIWRGVWG